MTTINMFRVKRELCDAVTQFDRLYRLAEHGELTDEQFNQLAEIESAVSHLYNLLVK